MGDKFLTKYKLATSILNFVSLLRQIVLKKC